MSNFNDEVCEYNSTPTTEDFAAKNGNCIVFHKSDCSEGRVRWYNNGGNARASECGYWLPDKMSDLVHGKSFQGLAIGDHNWTFDELANYKY
jgi:hypothetical protein